MTPAELKDSLLTGAPIKKKRNRNKVYHPRPVKTPKARTNIEWRLKGVYGNQQEVAEIARQNKVSRRKTDELLSGSKITYRCNAWKRTRCSFQMYALYTKDNKIFLYEGGEHDHTGIRVPSLAESPEREDGYQELSVMNSQGPHELGMVKNEPCSSQMCIPTPEIKFGNYITPTSSVSGAFNMSEFLEEEDPFAADAKCDAIRMSQNFAVRNLINTKNEMEMIQQQQQQIELAVPKDDPIELRPVTPQSPSKPMPMSLSYPTPLISKAPVMLSMPMQQSLLQPVLQQDPSRNLPQHYLNFISGRADLLQIAADYNLLFQYSSDQEMVFINHAKTQSLTIRNSGDPVTVQLIRGNNIAQNYSFSQSNWPNFIWGIRGLCLHFFFPNDVGRVGRIEDTLLSQANGIK